MVETPHIQPSSQFIRTLYNSLTRSFDHSSYQALWILYPTALQANQFKVTGKPGILFVVGSLDVELPRCPTSRPLLLGGSWNLVSTDNWAYEPAYN